MDGTHRGGQYCDCDVHYYDSNKTICDECIEDCKVCLNGDSCTDCYGDLEFLNGKCACSGSTYK